MNIEEQIVTLDATGCQTAVAEYNHNQQGYCLLAFKGNQETMNREVESRFEELLNPISHMIIPDDVYDEHNKKHGRIECHRRSVSSQLSFLAQKNQWPGLKSIVMIEERQISGSKVSVERQYFITNLPRRA